jgi:phosphate uptake regulator
MRPKDVAALHNVVRQVLKNRDDHDLKDAEQREVVVDDLCRLLQREFKIKLRPETDGQVSELD